MDDHEASELFRAAAQVRDELRAEIAQVHHAHGDKSWRPDGRVIENKQDRG